MYDVVIVGAGVIGGMVARELSRYQASVCLLEKENDVAMGASGANSGIIHAGYDPKPGTLKAEMNVKGAPLLYRAARELGVPFRKNGALVCAFSQEEERALEALYHRGVENGVWGLHLLTGREVRALEPALSREITLALHVPSSGIICPYGLTLAAVGNAMDNGVELLRGFQVSGIEKKEDAFVLTSEDKREVRGRYLINCAGLGADGIARLAGDGFFSLIPRKGEYLLLDKAAGGLVSHTVFQVPGKEGKGVLVSPTVDGNLLLGPTADPTSDRTDKDTSPSGMDRVITLSRKSVPSVPIPQTVTGFAGLRASEAAGDFIVAASGKVAGLLNVAAIDSPGLSSCVSIARRVLEILKEMGGSWEKKEHWNPRRTSPTAFREMSDEEKNAVIRSDPAYGRIVCRCEGISEGEIRAAIRQNPPARDLDGVKRRTRSGMGRCQGGLPPLWYGFWRRKWA
ncbi:MAG: NAD(P)/FAD-dependent oxidoreductase [Clostridia bacterium]|nr:NAD(P)/FAD-dependent oxidoreductase [Clostridia bacterium]